MHIPEELRARIFDASSRHPLTLEQVPLKDAIELARMLAESECLKDCLKGQGEIMLALLFGDALGLTIPQSLLSGFVDHSDSFAGELRFEAPEPEEGDEEEPPEPQPEPEPDPDTLPLSIGIDDENRFDDTYDQAELDRPVHWRRFEAIGLARGHILHRRVGVKTPRQFLLMFSGTAWRSDVAVYDVFKHGQRERAVEELRAWCQPLDMGELTRTEGGLLKGAVDLLKASSVKDDDSAGRRLQVFDWVTQNLAKKRYFGSAQHAREAVNHEVSKVEPFAPMPESVHDGVEFDVSVICYATARLITRIRRHPNWTAHFASE